jgi:predicted RNA-binding Zn-ribbon protein involved in translation (DUF1610 family)
MGTEDAIEREVQRRLTERAAAAGLAPGRISMEVLFMLPPEFVKMYTILFDRSLKESVVGGSVKDQAVTKRVTRQPRLSARGKSRIVPAGNSGGKRYREFWTIKDERAFRYKGQIDRRLRRLARDISLTLHPDSQDDLTRGCSRCGIDLHPHMELGYKIQFCPRCGTSIGARGAD